MTERSITDEWLSECDFKWRQAFCQPQKHWTLKLNIPDDQFSGWIQVSIELQRRGFEGRDDNPVGWMLWVTDTFERTAFLGNIRWQKEIIGLAEIITRRPWNPATHLHGQAWPEGSRVLKERPTT